VATFAPVTDLTALREFTPLGTNPLVRAMNLEAAADRLCDRPVWIIIGHDDERVGTDRSVSLAGALERAARARGLTPSVTLQVLPIPGHRSFPEWHDQAAEWFQKVIPANPRT
jgi:predicted esterase